MKAKQWINEAHMELKQKSNKTLINLKWYCTNDLTITLDRSRKNTLNQKEVPSNRHLSNNKRPNKYPLIFLVSLECLDLVDPIFCKANKNCYLCTRMFIWGDMFFFSRNFFEIFPIVSLNHLYNIVWCSFKSHFTFFRLLFYLCLIIVWPLFDLLLTLIRVLEL